MTQMAEGGVVNMYVSVTYIDEGEGEDVVIGCHCSSLLSDF